MRDVYIGNRPKTVCWTCHFHATGKFWFRTRDICLAGWEWCAVTGNGPYTSPLIFCERLNHGNCSHYEAKP